MKIYKVLIFISVLVANIFANDDIFMAIQAKNIAKVKSISEKSPDSVMASKDGLTVYMAACYNDFGNALDYFKGANINAVDQKGYSALMICSMLGNAEMVNKMSKMGANVNLQNLQGKTALMLAAFYGNTSTVKVLLNNDANKSIKDDKGWLALDFAKAKNKKEIVAILNTNGAK